MEILSFSQMKASWHQKLQDKNLKVVQVEKSGGRIELSQGTLISKLLYL